MANELQDGTARRLQSFNNMVVGSTSYWLCQEHYNIFIANGGSLGAGLTAAFDAGVVINAALQWSSTKNTSTDTSKPAIPRTLQQSARVLITDRAICPLYTAIAVPDAGYCYIESITGEPLLHLVAWLDTKTNSGSTGFDGIITNTTQSTAVRPSNVKLAGFSIGKPFSYYTGWYDGVLRSTPANERDSSAGVWDQIIPYFAAPISTNINAVIAMQQPGCSVIYFDNVAQAGAAIQINTRNVVAGKANLPITIDPLTGMGTPLTYDSAYTGTSIDTLMALLDNAANPGLGGFNLRLLALGCLVNQNMSIGTPVGFVSLPTGQKYIGNIQSGTMTAQMTGNSVPVGQGLLTITSGSSPAIGTLFDIDVSMTNTVPPGISVQAVFSKANSQFIVGYSGKSNIGGTMAPITFAANYQGVVVWFNKPRNPDNQYGQGFGQAGGSLQFPALLPKPMQPFQPSGASQPELEARPPIPVPPVAGSVQATEILFTGGFYNKSFTWNGNLISYPYFYRGHAINLLADDVEVIVNTFGFSQGQALLYGGGGGWRVPRAVSLYNDMRQDCGTFKLLDSYYLDNTPGPTQLGSGAGSVHFASGDQPIEPQQGSDWNQSTGFKPGANRPIDLIVDGARCWCPNAAAIAVVATVPTATNGNPQTPNLNTQNRATIRNATLLSGSPTGAVNVNNQNSSLSCQLYLENCDIDGWYQDTSGATGISVNGQSGPAILNIGRNVRVLNAACQAISATGTAQVFMADDFLAGQPQIDRVTNRSSGAPGASSLGWTAMPNASLSCSYSVVAGEFQAPAPSSQSPGSSGTPLQVGSSSSRADYTRIRVRLTYVPASVYALTIGTSSGAVIESAIGVPAGSQQANGLSLLRNVLNLNINSLHFEQIIGTILKLASGSNYVTNTGDIWTNSNALGPKQSSFFGLLLTG